MSNQHDQDRDRIAEAMNKVQTKSGWTEKEFESLDQAVYAFETLCEPKGWGLNMMSRGDGREKVWYVRAPEGANMLDDLSDALDDTWYAKSGNHAADVCRLVCMVLDREASDAK